MSKEMPTKFGDGGYTPMPADDPCAWMLFDGHTTEPVEGVYRASCYICRDPEFAMMGLPLCYACQKCGGHVPADDIKCTDCEHEQDEQEN